MTWHLDEQVNTRFGRIAAGRAGHGPDLVFAHGWPWSSWSWHRVLPVLAQTYRVHWYDMVGYGRSEMDPGQSSALDVQGELFLDMMEHWQLAAPRVVAHDFGGAVTLRAHLIGGFDFSAWVLMNVVAMRPWGSAFFDHVGKHVDAFTGLPPHIHEAVVRAYIRGALVNPLPDEDVEALVAPWLSEAGRVSFYRQFEQADERFTAEIEPDFDKVRCPVRLLWGRDDPWIPLARGQALAEAMGGAELTELPGLGHLPQLEDPARVAEAIGEALSVA